VVVTLLSERSFMVVTMVGGACRSGYCWRYQLRHFGEHFHVVAPDLRGYGESDKPEGVQSYEIEVRGRGQALMVVTSVVIAMALILHCHPYSYLSPRPPSHHLYRHDGKGI
jgi:pimeloyl-ACP methyl ester carboxylesterase